MGLVQMGPPTDFILMLKNDAQVNFFIETGTYYGNTAVWAASHFSQVMTVEFSKEIYDQVTESHKHLSNIRFMYGDSRQALKDIVPQLKEPAIFWLDSHWSGGLTYGAEDECPLIEELEIICQSAVPHYVLIDDARLFTAPPPKPHLIEQWPPIGEVLHRFKQSSHAYYELIYDDVIVAVPISAKAKVAEYFQNLTSQAWEQQGKISQESKTNKGIRLIREGTALLTSITYGTLKKSIKRMVNPAS